MAFVRGSLILFILIAPVLGQLARQNPSPMADTTRPHPRIAKTDVAGKRVSLQILNGATLYVGPKFKADRSMPLIMHFHGAPWLIEHHAARALPQAALVTVQLGAGSSSYGRPFADPELFTRLLAEVRKELGLEKEWSSITLTGFSAGYGAVRAILRQPENYRLINNVLLLDGIHASYVPDGKGLAAGGSIAAADLESFVPFAKDAVGGKKTFVLTHSEVFPGTFASTTECVDYLLAQLAIQRTPSLKQGPMGMQQLSAIRQGRFFVFGYAGNSAPDHIDHLHAMPAWFKFLKIK
jgi:hypothetical protein